MRFSPQSMGFKQSVSCCKPGLQSLRVSISCHNRGKAVLSSSVFVKLVQCNKSIAPKKLIVLLRDSKRRACVKASRGIAQQPPYAASEGAEGIQNQGLCRMGNARESQGMFRKQC